MIANKALTDAEHLFSALADSTRLRLLNLIRDEEVCVCFFVEALGESQPKISRHLAYLRKAGIVTARREGKWMHYRINFPDDELLSRILSNTLRVLETNSALEGEYKKLVEACCAPGALVTISRAPKPETLVEKNVSQNRSEIVEEQMETFLL